MGYLLSNNFEQAVGQLTYDEVVALVTHYNSVTPTELSQHLQDTGRTAGWFGKWEQTRTFASAYTAWEVHRAAWEASPTEYFSHCGASTDRKKRLARGECLYAANDTARASTFRFGLWKLLSTPRTGWRYMPTLFWGNNNEPKQWKLTSPNPGGSNMVSHAGGVGTGTAATINAAFPSGYRMIRIDSFPLAVRDTIPVPGTEIIYGVLDGQFDGGWPGLRFDQVYLAKMQTMWGAWLDGYVAQGGQLDYLFFDFEGSLGFWWVKNAVAPHYNYHPNHNPGTTSRNDLIADAQYTDQWLADNYMPTRAEWNNMNSWAEKYGPETYRFNEATFIILRKITEAIVSEAQERFPNLRAVDYEDTAKAGNVYPSSAPSSKFGAPLGCGHVPSPYYQSRNIYSGVSLTATQSECWFPGVGRTTLTRSSEVRFEPTALTAGRTITLGYENWVYRPGSPAGPVSTIGNTTFNYTVQAGQTSSLAIAQGLAASWNLGRSSGTPANAETGDIFRATIGAFQVNFTVLAGQTSAYQVSQGFANAWNLANGNTVVDNSIAVAIDTGGGTGYVAFQGDPGVETMALSVVNAGGSLTPTFTLLWPYAFISSHTATAVATSATTGYVRIKPDNGWQCRCEGMTVSLSGSGPGSVTKTIAEYGSWPRWLDDYFLLTGMNAGAQQQITPWILPRDDTSYCPFSPDAYKALIKATLFTSGEFAFIWNSIVTAASETELAAIYDEVVAEMEGVVGNSLPVEIRTNYNLTDTADLQRLQNGRIVKLTTNPDMTQRVNYQPTIEPIGNQTGEVGEELTFTVEADSTDTSVTTLTFSLSDEPDGAEIDPVTGVFSWTPIVGQGGTHEFTIWVTDDGPDELRQGETITVVVETPITNLAPTVNPIGTQSATEHVAWHVTASAEDPEDDNIAWSLGGTPPAGMTINETTGRIDWTPNETHGGNSYTITVIATDDGTPPLSGSRQFLINVAEVNTAPVLDFIPDQSGTEGVLITFQCSATDADLPAQTLTFTLTGTPPAGAAITSGGLFTWTPSGSQAGTYTIGIRVTDSGSGNLHDDQDVGFVIAESNVAPTIEAIPDQLVTVGEELTFPVVADDANDDDLAYSIDDVGVVPSGVHIDSSTGVFTWTPTSEHAGNLYDLVIRVTDDGDPSLSTTTTVRISVEAEVLAPQLFSIGNKVVLRGDTLLFTLLAIDPGAVTPDLTYSATGLPSGATLDADTGEFIWSTTERDIGEHSVVFVVSNSELSDSEGITITVTDLTRSNKPQKPAANPSAGAWWKFKSTGALRNAQ